jgi:ATP-dependent Clp protease, protease subunit
MNNKHAHKQPAIQNFSIGYNESYVRLTKARSMFLAEDVTTEVAADLSALLLYYDALSNTDEITLYIHSNGGAVAGLDNIYDVMQLIKAPVKTVCIGKAYSAGAVLLAAGTPGRRFAFKNANIMIHGIQAGFPIPGHDLVNSKNYFKYLDTHNSNIMKILANHTGHTLDKVKTDCLEDRYMTPKQAKEYGIIDHIIE